MRRSIRSGHSPSLRLIAHPPLPDAAVGALYAVRQAGLDVPGEISVGGIDDLRGAWFVGLTIVSLPLCEMGAMAARHIIAAPEDAPAATPPEPPAHHPRDHRPPPPVLGQAFGRSRARGR